MNTELAKRLVASPRWGWREGMRAVGGAYVKGAARVRALDERSATDEPEDGATVYGPGLWAWDAVDPEGMAADDSLPDLDDPATQGVLLAMLVESCGSFHALSTGLAAGIGPRMWCVLGARTGEWVASLGEALALALLAAWGEEVTDE